MRLFDKLFRYEAIDRIFSDVAYIQSLLEFEATLARAEAKAGVIAASDAPIIAAACQADQFNVEELAAQAALCGNVAIPLVKKLTELVAKENKDAARFVHWGATSQDAMDTGVVLQLRQAPPPSSSRSWPRCPQSAGRRVAPAAASNSLAHAPRPHCGNCLGARTLPRNARQDRARYFAPRANGNR